MERVERNQSTLPSPIYDLFKILVPGYWLFIIVVSFLAVNFPIYYSALSSSPAFPWLSAVSGLLFGLVLYDIDYPKNRRKFEQVRNVRRLSGKWFFFDMFKPPASEDAPFLDEKIDRHHKLATYLDYYVLNSLVDPGTKERVYYFMSTYHLFAELRFVTFWFTVAQFIVVATAGVSTISTLAVSSDKNQMLISGLLIFATIILGVVTIAVQKGHMRDWMYPEYLLSSSNPSSDGLFTNWRFLLILATGLAAEAAVSVALKIYLIPFNVEALALLLGGVLGSFLLSRDGNKGDRYLVTALETLRIWFDLHKEEIRASVSSVVRQESKVSLETPSISPPR
jgi:hypothetical protein